MIPQLFVAITSASIIASLVFFVHRKRQSAELRREFVGKRSECLDAAASFRKVLKAENYISKSEYPKWFLKYKLLKPLVQQCIRKKIRLEFEEDIKDLDLFFEAGASLIKKKNEELIQAELKKYQDLFDTIENHPLTESQRRAIVTEEKHNLTVAGAG
ncbi:MAG: hypothetical protein NWE78_02385, partial [Candidatus Bathyarchaeota archaeon]|nr:hypothetical protein [Candidatus Bathyarchaeota archaeon]